jgi:hypothetical protein
MGAGGSVALIGLARVAASTAANARAFIRDFFIETFASVNPFACPCLL